MELSGQVSSLKLDNFSIYIYCRRKKWGDENSRLSKYYYFCMLMIIFLNACSLETTKTKSEILEIPNEDEYTTLLVQGVDEDRGIFRVNFKGHYRY